MTTTEEQRQAAYDSGYDDGRAAILEGLAGISVPRNVDDALIWDDQGVTVKRPQWMTDEQWGGFSRVASAYFEGLGCTRVQS